MGFIAVIILGIVEGVTEFLPVSSTGHLILTSRLLGITPTEFLKSFEISIQLGAILSVLVLYRKRLLTDTAVLKRIIVAFIPTGIIGLLFYRIIKTYLLGNSSIVLWALLLGGIFIIVFEVFYREKNNSVSDVGSISYQQALLIGLFQSLAMVPGVSRAAATIMGGLMLGLKHKTIVEFSFLLAVPTMACAVGWDVAKTAIAFSPVQISYLLVGFTISFAMALVAIKSLLSFIKKNNFTPFGIYRIILALLLWRYI